MGHKLAIGGCRYLSGVVEVVKREERLPAVTQPPVLERVVGAAHATRREHLTWRSIRGSQGGSFCESGRYLQDGEGVHEHLEWGAYQQRDAGERLAHKRADGGEHAQGGAKHRRPQQCPRVHVRGQPGGALAYLRRDGASVPP